MRNKILIDETKNEKKKPIQDDVMVTDLDLIVMQRLA
jgi:hypothetical protein